MDEDSARNRNRHEGLLTREAQKLEWRDRGNAYLILRHIRASDQFLAVPLISPNRRRTTPSSANHGTSKLTEETQIVAENWTKISTPKADGGCWVEGLHPSCQPVMAHRLFGSAPSSSLKSQVLSIEFHQAVMFVRCCTYSRRCHRQSPLNVRAGVRSHKHH
jgi:hypothetical protein